MHGTTTTTNALLERKIAKVGLITTKGFRDVLELGRRTRPQPYGLRGTFKPLIDREVRLEVPERMDADGKVLTPLDEAAVAEAAKKLLAMGCEAVVIHFLHSYINPAHEKRAAEIVHALWPNGYITAGHAILSEYREYERGVTAAVNASVQPVLDRYLTRLRLELLGKSFDRDILVMQGNGGTASSQFIALVGGEHRDVGPGLGRDGGRLYRPRLGPSQPHHLRHGRHLDRCRPDRERRADRSRASSSSNTPCRSTCRWSTCTRSAPAAARSPRSMPRACCASGRRAPARGRGRSATAAAAASPPSPTPTWCWAGSIPTACWASTIR